MNCPIEINKNILLVAIGGGYDILGTVPLYCHFKDAIFANYNTESKFYTDDLPFPENRFHSFLQKKIYSLPKFGAIPLVKRFKEIIKENDISAVIAVDGGVDSLMTGFEANSGTLLEDLTCLTAINQLNIDKYLVCLGFGTETEEDISHYHVLKNIAAITQKSGFLGSCSLLKDSPEFKMYKECCESVWEGSRKSHIHTKIISAVLGNFNEENIYSESDARVINGKEVTFINPLMGILWFFSLECVISGNKLCDLLKNTTTSTDMLMVYRQFLNSRKVVAAKQEIPL